MKTIQLILLLSFLSITICIGQNKAIPKNLKQAIAFLYSDCSDSLKAIIKQTPDKDLKKLCYPWGGNYKVIYEWTNRDNDTSEIVKYFEKKGISFHQETVILIAFKYFLLGQKIDEISIYKPYKEIEKKWAEEDKVRFTTDSLRGVYIPKDIEDCFNQINRIWSDSIRNVIKSWTEDEFSGNVHMGFGMWMRNNWQLWGGSRLSKFFNDNGIRHPDDMSGIILTSYHRNLNNKEIDFEEQILSSKDYWEKSEKQALERKVKEFADYKIGDTVLFNYNLGYSTALQEEKFDNDICIAKGKILEKNADKFLLKIILLESCDSKGIIYYDNENYKVYNEKSKRWEKPKRRIIKYMNSGQVNWFNYEDWEIND